MVTQVTNSPVVQFTDNSQPPPVAVINNQKSAAPVELPRQSVQPVKDVDISTVKKAAEQINKLVQQFDRNIQFTVDQDTGTQVVKVIDTNSKEVIRQMPTPEMLAIAKALDKLQGLLIREKA